MKYSLLGTALVAATMAVPANATVVVSFAPASPTATAGTTVIQDFESFADGAVIGVNAKVFANSVSGVAARPNYGSTGNFAAVLGTPNAGSYTINFGPTNLFAFTLGSLDTYNSLTLLFVGGGSTTYSGGQIINDLIFPSGNQISGETNGQVSYRVTGGPLITGATFGSTANSFEFDNIATAVPEPATWGLMVLGFGMIGAAARSRKVKTTVRFA